MIGLGRQLAGVALLALLPLSWLASQRDYIHRSALDPHEPVYTSNYLEARGLLFPWVITEVPPELAPVRWFERVRPANLGVLYLLAAAPVFLLWCVMAAGHGLWRWFRR
jgi:hypothetical protein